MANTIRSQNKLFLLSLVFRFGVEDLLNWQLRYKPPHTFHYRAMYQDGLFPALGAIELFNQNDDRVGPSC